MSKETPLKLICPVCHYKEDSGNEYCGECGYVFGDDPRAYIHINRPYRGSAFFKSILCCAPFGALVLMYGPKLAFLLFPVSESYTYYSALAGYKDPSAGPRWLCTGAIVALGILALFLIAKKVLTPMFEEKKMEKISPNIDHIFSHNKKVMEEYRKQLESK